MEKVGIIRPLYCNYTSHWKSRFLDWELISPESLTYQEDDAFIYSVLNYPNPVRSWDAWPTLSLYCLKIYASQSAGALGLYRGTTKNRLTDIDDQDVKQFACSMNHPGPCLSTVSKIFPKLRYESDTYHKGEHLFHVDVLKRNTEASVRIVFDKIKRYPVTLGSDGQEINQGTFLHNGKLYGLQKPMTAEEIRSIGLENLSQHIASKNPFLSGTREYRCRDFAGLFCSNSYTFFEAGSYNGEECKAELLKVLALVRRCTECAKNDIECSYATLDVRCEYCNRFDHVCESLVPFHVLWDMEGAQVAAKEMIFTIDENSGESTLRKSDVFTIGFGGLHLCKNLINPGRNCVLTFDGENYGIHILRAYKLHPSLSDVKNAVFLCKDRQEDFLAWLTVNSVIQNALKVIKTYHIVRVPEPLVQHHDNCKTQKRFLHPVGLCCNKNGDIFVLDAGRPCIHVINRSAVSKVVTVGSFGLTKYSHLKMQTGSDLKFSNSIRSMISMDDTLYVADPLRGEIIILTNCAKATSLGKSPLFVVAVENCSSVAIVGNYLAVLQSVENTFNIKVIKHDVFPKQTSNDKDKEKKKFIVSLSFKTIANLSLSKPMFSLYQLHISSKHKHFGGWGPDQKISFFLLKNKKIVESETNIVSTVSPDFKNGKLLTIQKEDKNTVFSLKLSGTGTAIETEEIDPLKVSTRNVVAIHSWGSVVFLVRKADTNTHLLEEFGPLNFGLQYSKAVNVFYDCISYHPRSVKNPRKLQLTDSIEGAAATVEFFTKMQKSKEGLYPNRKSFVHLDGMPWSSTISCLEHTVGSWKAIQKRLDQYVVVNRDKIDPHVITNESVVEHTFGTQKRRGQGNNQTMKEYVETKRLNAVDFQIRMCKTPFNQHCLSKVFNKSYQDLDKRYLKISFKELCEIFKSESTLENDDFEISEEQQALLNKAYALSKSIPRQSGRNRWRLKAGHAPNMLTEKKPTGILLKGDLLVFVDIDDSLVYYIVIEDFELTSVESKVKVSKVGNSASIMVAPDRFLTHDGMIFTVPKALYSILSDGTISFTDNEINNFIEKQKFAHTQMDISVPGTESEAEEVVDFTNNSNLKRGNDSTSTDFETVGKSGRYEHGYDQNGEERPLLRGDCVKIINGNRQGHYALFTGELVGDNLEMNYFELKYGKYILKEGEVEPRSKTDIMWVDYDFDKHNRYTFMH